MIVKQIQDKMYKRKIYFIYDFDQRSFDRKFHYITFKDNEDKQDEYFKGTVITGLDKPDITKMKKNVWFVILNKHKTKKEEKETLIHELYHLTLMIAEYQGFEISRNSDEPLAYYNEHLYKQFFNTLYK